MINNFDKFQVPEGEGCNCRVCQRIRYEQDLVERIAPHLPAGLTGELLAYLEWYFEALAHAETEVEMFTCEKREALTNARTN